MTTLFTFRFNETLGSIGVLLLLLAFSMNLLKWMKTDSLIYIGLNVLGSSISALASVFIPYWPFFVLEGVWALVSVFAFMRALKRRREAKAAKG